MSIVLYIAKKRAKIKTNFKMLFIQRVKTCSKYFLQINLRSSIFEKLDFL